MLEPRNRGTDEETGRRGFCGKKMGLRGGSSNLAGGWTAAEKISLKRLIWQIAATIPSKMAGIST